MTAAIPLDAQHIHGFVANFLLASFDEQVPIANHHLAWWRLVCDPHPRVAIAGPRSHAKSTALNHSYGLAASMFKAHPLQLKVCRTYDLATEKILQVKTEIDRNEKLRRFFGVKGFRRERDDDVIVEYEDGYSFRMMAMGMDQAKRGYAWGTMRPSLIQIDDGEDDEEVLNPESRRKTFNKLMRVIMPMGGDHTKFRVYGTILHQDSMLAKLLKSRSWKSARFEACDENLSEASILWPQKFPRERLLEIRQMYIDGTDDDHAGGLAGFNMEYRNIAIDTSTSYFQPSDFRPMREEDHATDKTFYVGGDLAFSQKQGRDFTVFVVGGLDEEGILHIVDERRGRWDGKEVIDQMYAINEAWHPEEWFIEHGAIKATLGTALEMRMADEGYLNLCPNLIPTKDKAIRATPVQARMRARGIRFDTEASWFPAFKEELLEFSQEGTRGAHDDRVDALAWLGQGLKRMATPPTEEEVDEEALELAQRNAGAFAFDGRSLVTGY